jgi:gas vesicle protein
MVMNAGKGDFLMGLIVGGLAGMVSGILFAPKSGKETRQDIVNASDSAMRRLKEMEAEAEKKIGDAGKRVSGLAQQGKEAFQDQKDRVRKALDAGIGAFKEGKQNPS